VDIRRLTRLRFTFLLCLPVLLSCKTHGRTEPEPVAECQEYEDAFARCTGVHAPIASQPAALASSDAEREQLREICLTNLSQLKQACR
jgi:hypothetical protein